MTRFLLALFGKSYEPCKSCEVLKEQLAFERSEKAQLLDTLTSLLKPQVIIQPTEQPKPLTPRFTMWSRRRAELERADKEAARLNKASPLVARPDNIDNAKDKDDSADKTPVAVGQKTIDQLESELGVVNSESSSVQEAG